MRRQAKVNMPGRSSGFNADKFPYYWPGGEWTTPDTSVRTTLQPVDEEDATLEAEQGEIAFVPDIQGLPATYTVGGNRHASGGTPLNLPDESFIFSDTRDMKIGGEILQHFGKPKDTKKKYTPADLAKQYNINKFRKTLADPDSDQYQIKTAEMMIANYNKKLGMLGLVQESKKGFPDGIPMVAMPYLMTAAVEPESVLPLKGAPDPFQGQQGMMKYGGNAFQNSPTGGGFWQLGGQPKTESQWYDYVTGALNAPVKGAMYLGEHIPYAIEGFDPQFKPKAEMPGDVWNRYQKIFGTRRPMTQGEQTVANIAGDPLTWLGVSGAAKTAYSAASTVGKGALDVSRYVKGLSQKAILELMDFFKTKDIKSLVKALGKAADPVLGRVAPVLSKFNNKSDTPNQPQFPQQRTPLPVENYVARREDDPAYSQHQIDSMFPEKAPIITNQPDTIFNYKYGGVPKYQSGGKTGWYKEGSKYVLYNNGSLIRSQSTDPKLKTSPKTAAKSQRAVPTYDPYIDPETRRILETNPYYSQHPELYTPRVQGFQPHNPKGGYGSQDYSNENFYANNKDLMDEFERVHKRKYNINKNEDAEWFQPRHRQQTIDDAVAANIPKEKAEAIADTISFKTKWGKHDPRGLDSKTGDWTKSRVRFKFTPEVAKAAAKAPAINPNKMIKTSSPADAPWWLQDVVKTAGAAGDLLRLKKYLPWAPKIAPYVPEATFYDPTRELASNTEQMSIGTQGAGVFSGPQQYSANFSGIQAKGAKNAADILGKYNNLNVGISNQANAMKADAFNKANELNAKTSIDLYDKTTLANQNFDNSKNMARQELRNSYIDAITNRSSAQVLNSLYPNYQIDPSTGGMMYFAKGDQMLPASQGNGFEDRIRALKYSDPSMTWDDAYKIALGPEQEQLLDSRGQYYQNYRGSRRSSPRQVEGYPNQ